MSQSIRKRREDYDNHGKTLDSETFRRSIGCTTLLVVEQDQSIMEAGGCKYHDRLNLWASAVQCEPVKSQSDNGMSATSPMIKLAKNGEEEAESFSTV